MLELGGCSFNLGGGNGGTENSDTVVVNSTDWVAFQGRGVLLAVFPREWRVIPFDVVLALEEHALLMEQDPTVANVYRDLVNRYIPDTEVLLVLMRNDGTAWFVIRQNGETDFQTQVETLTLQHNAQGTRPIDRTTINLDIGEATAWKIDYSPTESQIVNRRWVVLNESPEMEITLKGHHAQP